MGAPSSIYSSTLYEPTGISSPKPPLSSTLDSTFHRFSKDYLQFGIAASDLNSPIGNGVRKPGTSRHGHIAPFAKDGIWKNELKQIELMRNSPSSRCSSTAKNEKSNDVYVKFTATEHRSGNKTVVVKFTEHYIQTFYHSQKLEDKDSRFWHWKRFPGEERFGKVVYESLQDLMSGIKFNKPEVIYIESDKIGSLDTT